MTTTRFMAAATLISAILISIDISAEEQPVVERTENRYRADMAGFLDGNIVTLSRRDGKVFLVSTGRLGIRGDSGWVTRFVLEEGDKFLQAPDHHGSGEFALEKAGDESVKIRYESTFDHRSFGPNRISIDTGTVEIRYRDADSER